MSGIVEVGEGWIEVEVPSSLSVLIGSSRNLLIMPSERSSKGHRDSFEREEGGRVPSMAFNEPSDLRSYISRAVVDEQPLFIDVRE